MSSHDSTADDIIRTARIEDASTIIEFNRRLARETEHRELDPDTIAAGVRAILLDSSKGRYFVAESGGTVVGQLMHTWEWSDWRNGQIWWLQSVYVTAHHRGRGVFRNLFEHVHRLASATPGVVGLRLYVEKQNAPAQSTYLKLGLEETSYIVLEQMLTRAGSEHG